MKRKFIMTPAFDRSWSAIGLDDSDLAILQTTLLIDPEAGELIPGTGGARKVRVPAKDHGKRGGARVIYVDLVVLEEIYLLAAYAKNEQTNMTEDEKKIIRNLIKALKE
ncbi:MAG: type II toxin-antitoxin system RelE/ParE family toxin [Christensenellales bacterium]